MPTSSWNNKLPKFVAAIIFTGVFLLVGNYLIFDYGNRRIESLSAQIIEVHEPSIRGLDIILLQLQSIRFDVLLISMQADGTDQEHFTSGEELKGVIQSINASTYLIGDLIEPLSDLSKEQDQALITELYRELIDSLPEFLEHRVILGTEFAGINLTGFDQFQRKVSQLNALHQQREEQLSIQLAADSHQFNQYFLFFAVVSILIAAAIITKMAMVIQKSFWQQFRIQQQHLGLLEGTPGGILECDLSGAVLYSNSACSRITGLASHQINNRPIQDLIPELQGSQTLANRLQSLAGKQGEENGFETKVINLQGQEVNIQLDWRFDREERSQSEKIIFTLTDITRRVHAESEQNRLLTALDASINEIYMFHADSLKFTYVSPGARANLGFDMASLEQMTPVSIKPEHTLETFAELASPLFRKEKSQLVFDTVHQRADGSRYSVEVRMQLVHDLEPPQYLAIISDITARKLVEIELEDHREHLEHLVAQRTEELEQAKEAAESANEAKSRFLANMSHEIRTPMNGVMGMAELLSATDLNTQQQLYTQTISNSAQTLLQIINDILDLSKIEAGRVELEAQPFDIEQMINDCLVFMAPQAKKKGVELVAVVDPDMSRVLIGDALRIYQVLTNLVGNALKFTTEGKVLLRAQIKQSTGERVVVRMEVADTGIGIEEQALDGVFEAFSQVDETNTRLFGGTGLGLSICKQLVELMGGQIGVSSQLNVGSTFWCELPLAVSETMPISDTVPGSQSKEPEILPAQAPNTLGRVLVVEDNVVNQMVAEGNLSHLGYQVSMVSDGQAAITLLSIEHFDLVLMDCQMPGMDGFEATRYIRAGQHGDRHIPIIGLTAHASADSRKACLNAGMDDFISKPYTTNELGAVLLRWRTRTSDSSTTGDKV